MRPGPLRRAAWSGLAGVLAASGLFAFTVTTAPAASADITVSEVFGRPASGVFTIRGHGWGHGHGMSQHGAQGGASLGKTADQITAFYYPGTARVVQSNSDIRVKLSSDSRTTVREFIPAANQTMRDLATGATLALPTTASLWRVTSNSSGLKVAYVQNNTTTTLSPTYAGPLRVSGTTFIRARFSDSTSRDYRTSVLVRRSGSASLISVAVMKMESYLYGVVPRESLSSWDAKALQSQSIAARSYSTYKREHVSSTSTSDICDTTQCQVFMGSARYTASGTRTSLESSTTTAAINATAGVIRTYGGKAIFAEYSSSNGGWSTTGSTPYLIAQRDDWDGIPNSTVHSWDAKLPVSALEARYSPSDSNGTPLWRFSKLIITSRDGNGEWGGRVLTAKVELTDSAGGVHQVDATGSGLYSSYTWPARSDGLRSRWFSIVPSYAAQLISRNTAPRLVLPPGQGTGKLVAVYQNTGSVAWPVSGLHLTLANPVGGKDRLAKNSTQPGVYEKNLTQPGATSVAPGDRAQFGVSLDATGLNPGTYNTGYRVRLGSAGPLWSPANWSVTVADPVFASVGAAPPVSSLEPAPSNPGAPPALFADGRTVVVPRTGSTDLKVSVRNTGNVSWPAGSSSPVMLGTSSPRDRPSSSRGESWLWSTRPAGLSGTSAVAVGGVGHFALSLYGNGKPVGVTSEAFEPLWSGKAWMGSVIKLNVVRVDPAVSRVAGLDATSSLRFGLPNAPTGQRYVYVRLRNLGADPWQVGTERLGTDQPFPLASGWASSTRTPAMRANVTRPGATAVHPGEVGEWRLEVSAYQHDAGLYETTLRAAGPAGLYGPGIPLKISVVDASFRYTLVKTSPRVDVAANGHRWTYFDVRNDSNFAWSLRGSLRSRTIAGSSPSQAQNWYRPTRPGPLTINLTQPSASQVRPGEVARFGVLLAGNGRTPRTASELFGFTWDGWRGVPLQVSLSYRVL